MKRFLRMIIFFSLGLAALNAAVFAIVAPLVDGEGYLKKVSGMPEGMQGIVLADSHGTRLDDAALGSAGIANLSEGSDSYDDMLNKLEYSIRHYPIGLVILTADGHCLSKYREYTNNLDKSSLLVGGNGYKAVLRQVLPLLDPKSRDLFKASVSARFSRALARGASPTASLTSPTLPWKDNPDRARLAARRAETQFKFAEPSRRLGTTLDRIAGLCEERGIRLVGLRFPLSGDYLREIGGRDYGAATRLKTLDTKIIDGESLYADRDELFKDQDHLSQEGGRLFTRLLLDELRSGGYR